MSEPKKKALVPKLRFPEFRDQGEWESRLLEDALSPIVRERKKPVEHYTGLGIRSHGKGTFIKLLENPEKNAMDYLYEVHTDDLIVNITFAWEGAIAIAQQSDAGALVSHRFPTYTFKKSVAIPEFFRYIILDKRFVYNLGLISPGGAGRNRVLNKKDFLKLTVLLPELEEQQKIAACLSSIDELIAAQSQKLAALKAHKKGLMQQLFPAEGETVPKLRFPEFRDADGWVNKKLCDIADVNASGDLDSEHFSPTKTDEHIYPIYSNAVTQEGLYGFCTYPKYQKNSVTVTARGTLGVAFYRDHDYVGIGRLLILSNLNNAAPYFLQEIWNHSAEMPLENSGIPQLTAIKACAVELYMPEKAEQQKIAACLASLDELISAQSQKIDALKAHKKGLMQQLFPAV